MERTHSISASCGIKDGRILLDGQEIFSNQEQPTAGFLKEAFRKLRGDYPKFFKMDELSKLAFLTADLLIGSAKENKVFSENCALVFANRSSSLDTDRKHQESIQDASAYFPSPAIFVYTLPNICMGEISIRHKLRTENSFFILDSYDSSVLNNYADALLAAGKADQVLCAWVDKDDDQYESIAYLLERSDSDEERKSRDRTCEEIYKRL